MLGSLFSLAAQLLGLSRSTPDASLNKAAADGHQAQSSAPSAASLSAGPVLHSSEPVPPASAPSPASPPPHAAAGEGASTGQVPLGGASTDAPSTSRAPRVREATLAAAAQVELPASISTAASAPEPSPIPSGSLTSEAPAAQPHSSAPALGTAPVPVVQGELVCSPAASRPPPASRLAPKQLLAGARAKAPPAEAASQLQPPEDKPGRPRLLPGTVQEGSGGGSSSSAKPKAREESAPRPKPKLLPRSGVAAQQAGSDSGPVLRPLNLPQGQPSSEADKAAPSSQRPSVVLPNRSELTRMLREKIAELRAETAEREEPPLKRMRVPEEPPPPPVAAVGESKELQREALEQKLRQKAEEVHKLRQRLVRKEPPPKPADAQPPAPASPVRSPFEHQESLEKLAAAARAIAERIQAARQKQAEEQPDDAEQQGDPSEEPSDGSEAEEELPESLPPASPPPSPRPSPEPDRYEPKEDIEDLASERVEHVEAPAKESVVVSSDSEGSAVGVVTCRELTPKELLQRKEERKVLKQIRKNERKARRSARKAAKRALKAAAKADKAEAAAKEASGTSGPSGKRRDKDPTGGLSEEQRPLKSPTEEGTKPKRRRDAMWRQLEALAAESDLSDSSEDSSSSSE